MRHHWQEKAVFTLKVNYIYKEATDALVAKLDSAYNTKTVKAFKEAAKERIREPERAADAFNGDE